MSSTPEVPPEWESFTYRDRPFFHFDLRVKDNREQDFSVAQQIADRYAVFDVLARGGGGVVFRAKDELTGQFVLIKALAEYDMHRADLDEPVDEVVESIRRARHHLQTERRILVQLRNEGCRAVPHPHDYAYDANPALAGPYQTEQDQEWRFDDESILHSEPYLVMQHVTGASLRDILEKVGARGLDQQIALYIIDQVAAVIQRVQQPRSMPKGQTWQLVYQDLKPANILIDSYGRATVIDFGGCQLKIDDTLVLHGSHSRGYCAPESGYWENGIYPSADCYCLGTTLFHMLSGIHPKEFSPPQEYSNHPRAVEIDATRLANRCHPDVIEFVHRCVQWDVAARFQTVAEFRSALAELIHATAGIS